MHNCFGPASIPSEFGAARQSGRPLPKAKLIRDMENQTARPQWYELDERWDMRLCKTLAMPPGMDALVAIGTDGYGRQDHPRPRRCGRALSACGHPPAQAVWGTVEQPVRATNVAFKQAAGQQLVTRTVRDSDLVMVSSRQDPSA
jgi:hypothetical protein